MLQLDGFCNPESPFFGGLNKCFCWELWRTAAAVQPILTCLQNAIGNSWKKLSLRCYTGKWTDILEMLDVSYLELYSWIIVMFSFHASLTYSCNVLVTSCKTECPWHLIFEWGLKLLRNFQTRSLNKCVWITCIKNTFIIWEKSIMLVVHKFWRTCISVNYSGGKDFQGVIPIIGPMAITSL